jgi:small subunit ribosomal protein S17e
MSSYSNIILRDIINKGEMLGNIRPMHIKNIARELVRLYAHEFTTDYQHNKQKVGELLQVQTTDMRNKIAGYVTRLITHKKS